MPTINAYALLDGYSGLEATLFGVGGGTLAGTSGLTGSLVQPIEAELEGSAGLSGALVRRLAATLGGSSSLTADLVDLGFTWEPTVLSRLQSVYGIDIGFDWAEIKDCRENSIGTDFEYVAGPEALIEEIYRLLDLTPIGSFLDDPTYGIDLSMIGMANNPNLTVAMTRFAFLRALRHPSFATRFQVKSLAVTFDPAQENALVVNGVLELFGFEGSSEYSFGPYALRYLSKYLIGV